MSLRRMIIVGEVHTCCPRCGWPDGEEESPELDPARVARVAAVMWRALVKHTDSQVHGLKLGCPRRCALNAVGGRFTGRERAAALALALDRGWVTEVDGRLRLGDVAPQR